MPKKHWKKALDNTVFGRKNRYKDGLNTEHTKITPEKMVRTLIAGPSNKKQHISFFTNKTPDSQVGSSYIYEGLNKCWKTLPVTYVSYKSFQHRTDKKIKHSDYPRKLIETRNRLNEEYGKGTFEILHSISRRFKLAAGVDANTNNNLMVGSTHANSAMTLVEAAITALISKHECSFYLWADVLMDDEGVGYELIYHISLKNPVFSAVHSSASIQYTKESHYQVRFPLLLGTRPGMVHQYPLFDNMEAYFFPKAASCESHDDIPAATEFNVSKENSQELVIPWSDTLSPRGRILKPIPFPSFESLEDEKCRDDHSNSSDECTPSDFSIIAPVGSDSKLAAMLTHSLSSVSESVEDTDEDSNANDVIGLTDQDDLRYLGLLAEYPSPEDYLHRSLSPARHEETTASSQLSQCLWRANFFLSVHRLAADSKENDAIVFSLQNSLQS